MLYIQSFMILILEILCCKIFYEIFGERRKKSRIWDCMVMAVLAGVSFLAVNLLSQKLVLKMAVVVMLIAAAMYAVFQITFLKSMILAALFQALLLLVDYLALLMAVGLFGSVKEIEKTYLREMLTTVLSKAILFLCVILIRRALGKKDAALLKDTEWVKFIFFPVFSICTLLAMVNAVGGIKNSEGRGNLRYYSNRLGRNEHRSFLSDPGYSGEGKQGKGEPSPQNAGKRTDRALSFDFGKVWKNSGERPTSTRIRFSV